MTLPNLDIIIVAIAALFVAFALVGLHSRIIGSLLSAYAAYLVTLTWSPSLHSFLTGGRTLFGFTFAFKIESYWIAIVMLVCLWLLFTVFVGFATRSRMPMTEVMVHAIFTVAFIFSSILTFFPVERQMQIMSTSKLAMIGGTYHQLLLLVPVIFLLFSAMRHSHHDR